MSHLPMLLVCSCLVGIASAQTSGHRLANTTRIRQELQALYDQASSAAKHNNMTAYGRADAPDFIIIHSDGTTMNKAQMDQEVSPQEKQSLSVVTVTQTIESIVLQNSGHRAVVKVKGHFVATVYDAQVKRRVKSVLDETTLDTWVKTPTGWLRKSSGPASPRSNDDLSKGVGKISPLRSK